MTFIAALVFGIVAGVVATLALIRWAAKPTPRIKASVTGRLAR
jgi:uncharacterized membrane protein YedE/YeeE